jgi:Protein of unknown function (DUF4232)
VSSLLDTTGAVGRLETVKAAFLILALPLLAAACGGTNASSSGTTTASAPPPATTTGSTSTVTFTQGSTQTVIAKCTAADVTVSAKGGDAGAGHRSSVFVLTNTTQAPCSVDGYPGMAFLDASGAVVRGTVERGDSYLFSDPGPSLVVLQPGDAASYSLGWSEANGATCATSTKVQVTPPDDTNHATLLSQVVVCPGRPVTVSAVVAGDAGAG